MQRVCISDFPLCFVACHLSLVRFSVSDFLFSCPSPLCVSSLGEIAANKASFVNYGTTASVVISITKSDVPFEFSIWGTIAFSLIIPSWLSSHHNHLYNCVTVISRVSESEPLYCLLRRCTAIICLFCQPLFHYVCHFCVPKFEPTKVLISDKFQCNAVLYCVCSYNWFPHYSILDKGSDNKEINAIELDFFCHINFDRHFFKYFEQLLKVLLFVLTHAS